MGAVQAGRGEGGRGPPAHAPTPVWSRQQGDPAFPLLLLPVTAAPAGTRPLLCSWGQAVISEEATLTETCREITKSEMRTVSERRWFVECVCVSVCVCICACMCQVYESVSVCLCVCLCAQAQAWVLTQPLSTCPSSLQRVPGAQHLLTFLS